MDNTLRCSWKVNDMKKRFGVIALVCLAVLTLCGCDEQNKNKDEFQRSYTSLYVETYAGAQRNELTSIYEWLYSKSERVPLARDIELDLQDIDSMTGTISFRLANEMDKELWKAKLDATKGYLSIIATVYAMQDGGVTVYCGGSAMDENFTLSQLMEELPKDRAAYEQGAEGIRQLVNDLQLDLTADDVEKIWRMRQAIQLQYQETLKLLNSDEAAYDIPLYSCFFDENVETGRYQALAYVLKDEELNTGKKTDEEYEKTAEILMTQYPQIEQITFRIMNETEKNNYETEKVLVFVSPWQ